MLGSATESLGLQQASPATLPSSADVGLDRGWGEGRVCRVFWSEGPVIEIKVGGVVGDVKTPNMGDLWLRLSAQVIKKHFTPFKYHSKL